MSPSDLAQSLELLPAQVTFNGGRNHHTFMVYYSSTGCAGFTGSTAGKNW